jgi:TetR/AcrR family transcriptional repressor of nem operon
MYSTKEHILFTAFKLFLQKNFKEVTMKEIVEKTGLSKGAFYHYFTSKEQLFKEILDLFFATILTFDFNSLISSSLYDFYNDYSGKINSQRFDFLKDMFSTTEIFDINFFSLLFEAFKMFPEFKNQMEKYHHKEVDAWVSVISEARKSGEIKTPLSDEQVAKIFLFTSDGLIMNLTMDGVQKDISLELKSIWDNFYITIKA